MKDKFKKYWIEITGIIGIIVLLIWLFNFLNNLFDTLYLSATTPNCHEIYGYFGSYVGGVFGTMLTAITLFIVYITYRSQRNLSFQQQFETTFFNLLNIHIDIKKNLKIDFKEVDFKPNAANLSLIKSGVLKSGSPKLKLMMSFP